MSGYNNNILFFLCVAITLMGAAPSAKYRVEQIQNGAKLQGSVIFTGDVPAPKVMLISKDNNTCGTGNRQIQWVELGGQLFFDKKLSADGTVACATCHNPLLGFTDGESVATGINQQQGTRSSPTIINRLFSQVQFWDGRAGSLEEQALGPMENPIEMANSLENIVQTVAANPHYQIGFQKAFDSEITISTIVKAITSFERTLVSGNSLYDQFKADNTEALSESAKRGLTLFESERANCTACHSGHNFTNEAFRNNGAGMDAAVPDSGRFKVTGDVVDFGAFKVPTLRDIARTAPYMHDGSLSTLPEVVEFYNRGGIANKYQSMQIKELNLTAQEKRDLVAFLKSLSGRNVWQAL